MRRVMWGVLLFVLVLVGWAYGEVEELTEDGIPVPVRQRLAVYRSLGVEVKGYVRGPGGLVGVVVHVPEGVLRRVEGLEMFAKGGDTVFYLTPDGRQMVVGFVFDLTTGKELSSEAVSRYGAVPDVGPSMSLEQVSEAELKGLYGVEMGRGGDGTYYCFVDMRCPHSLRQFQEMREAGVHVVWVPITLGHPLSTTRASFLLGIEKPTAVDLERAMTRGASLAESFGHFNAEEKKVLAKGVMRLEENVTFARTHGVKSTPTCVYVKSGRVVRVFRGAFDAEFISANR